MDFLEILAKYSNGSNWFATDKITTHSYGDVYNDILPTLRGKPDLTILEIGVMSGMFVGCLTEFLPEAKIYGIDIQLNWLQYKGESNPRVHYQIMDGTADDTPERLGMKYDLIIDDASHLPHHQTKTLDIFAPYLKEGGVYIIEDIYPEDKLKKELEEIATKHGLIMEWIDLRHQREGVIDNVLAVFRR